MHFDVPRIPDLETFAEQALDVTAARLKRRWTVQPSFFGIDALGHASGFEIPFTWDTSSEVQLLLALQASMQVSRSYCCAFNVRLGSFMIVARLADGTEALTATVDDGHRRLRATRSLHRTGGLVRVDPHTRAQDIEQTQMIVPGYFPSPLQNLHVLEQWIENYSSLVEIPTVNHPGLN